MLTHRWPEISSDFIYIYKKIVEGRGSALDPAGSSRLSHIPPSRTADGSRLWNLHPTVCAFGSRAGLRCQNHGHLNLLIYPSDFQLFDTGKWVTGSYPACNLLRHPVLAEPPVKLRNRNIAKLKLSCCSMELVWEHAMMTG